ncbi:hypothetical protein [Burkholderia pseudomallei]|uniref:hypothetical protein n=1 Tax=Burkholderia pseudomallei TaxID=28450 RepID=UPI000572774B|nr:hypothetical protein [Burkholderia pseudomallei]
MRGRAPDRRSAVSGHDLRRAGDRRRAPAVRSRGADLPAAGYRLPANAHRVKPHHEPRHPCGRPLIR